MLFNIRSCAPLLVAVASIGCVNGDSVPQQRDSSAYPSFEHTAAEQPLTKPSIHSNDFKAGSFTINRQDNTTCSSYGEAQWAGTVDVSDEHRLFFWFSESRNDPDKDPIMIWMNGGPGGSSMMGLFTEMGPCLLENDAKETSPNPWAWNNNASIIFLDQPAGTGFSSIAEGGKLPAHDLDGAEDFQTFLNVFFERIFPEKARLPIHIVGESYAGHMVPVYVKHILDARSFDGRNAFWGNITSLVLVNALLDWAAVGVGIHQLLCTDYRGKDFLTPAECDKIRLALPELERLGQVCDITQDGNQCAALFGFHLVNIDSYYRELVLSGERNMYNGKPSIYAETIDGICLRSCMLIMCFISIVNERCLHPPVCQDLHHGNVTWYLNQNHIKSALGIPQSHVYQILDLSFEERYAESCDFFKTTTAQLANILDTYETTGLADIRLLVLNGNEDYTINTPGQMYLYDNLRWGGQAEYRITPWKALPDDNGAKGILKGTVDGRLVFVGLDGAGHAAPGDVGEGSYRVIEKWLQGKGNDL